MGPKVLIVDYGMGNIRSLRAAVEHLGSDVVVSGNPRDIVATQILMLPGVGSFPAAMQIIENRGLTRAIQDAVLAGSCKLLGICLGMQLLLDSSNEGNGARGLGLIGGSVERFAADSELPVPHIGFNSVRAPSPSILFNGLSPETDFYFVHSYRAVAVGPTTLAATSHYGEGFVAAVEHQNVYGTQFHPEKSQSNGLQVLGNFLAAEIR